VGVDVKVVVVVGVGVEVISGVGEFDGVLVWVGVAV